MNSQSTNTNKILDRQYLNLLENINFRPIFIMLPCTHKSSRSTLKISNFLFSKESGDFSPIINNQRLLIINNGEIGASGLQARLIPEPMSFGIRCVYTVVFIMGDHRSGTTLLHKTLVATECFNFVRAYHVIKYDEILSNYVNRTEVEAKKKIEELLKSLDIKTRGIDKVEVSSDLPTEYGFILKNAGYESYLNPENLSLFTELCRKIQFSSNLDRPLLLKNPWDFPRFIHVKKTFPETRFIFIHRHPIHVINSKLKAARTLLFTFNAYTALISRQYKKIFKNPVQLFFYRLLYSSYFDLGLHQITKGTVQSINYFLENIKSLPKTDYVSVRYEDLCQVPEETILKILGFLGLETKATLDYEKLIEPRPLKLLPEVEKNYAEICQELQSYLTYHSYNV